MIHMFSFSYGEHYDKKRKKRVDKTIIMTTEIFFSIKIYVLSKTQKNAFIHCCMSYLMFTDYKFNSPIVFRAHTVCHHNRKTLYFHQRT